MHARPTPTTSFVVRVPGEWSACAVTDTTPETLSLPDVLALLGDADGTNCSGDTGTGAEPVGVDTPVAELGGWVGVTNGGFVHLEDGDGGPLTLDSDDLRLLDAVAHHPTPEALSAVTGLPIDCVLQRVGRLLNARRLHVGEAGTATHGAPAMPPGTTDDAPTPVGPDDVTAPAEPDVTRVPERVPLARRVRAALRRTAPGADEPPVPQRIPVYAVWHEDSGPLLALGMLTAAARHHRGGALNDVYEIRRPERADSFLEDLAHRRGPAILLASDYVWSVRANLEMARRALRLNPELLVIHGGPSCPKYVEDAERFLDEHGEVAHLLVRGEGEEVICELLDELAPSGDEPGRPTFDEQRLAQVAGCTFRGADGRVVRTPDRDRISDLDALPSPYLTGEFDHIPAAAWNYCMSVETNRGCPYGCTFCDWGSSTMSRIRKFDQHRVAAEIDWAARRGVVSLNIPDANFGIMRRDVDTARCIADAAQRTGYPRVLVFYPAKNTTRHLADIMDILAEANISSAASLSLQSTDPATLAALDRTNISTEHFVSLAAEYRRRGHPLQGDLLLGIPEQTYQTYRDDLQFMLDHEILVRTWPVQMLPNAPMNDPDYRAAHGLVVDDRQLVVGANSFDRSARNAMLRLRMVDIVCERLGVLRHVLRWAQWDHGLPATELMDRLISLVDTEPQSWPALSWALRVFDLVPEPAVGWTTTYEQVRAALVHSLGLPDDGGLDVVLAVQRHLMPRPGRTFPDTIELEHDYVAYYRDATVSLYDAGHASGPPRPLRDYPPGRLTVQGDPLGLCGNVVRPGGDSRSETMQGDFLIGSSFGYELWSPLTRLTPPVAAAGFASDLFTDHMGARESSVSATTVDGAAAGVVLLQPRRAPVDTSSPGLA